jgi:exonuclease III
MRIFHVPGTGHSEGVIIVLGPGLHLSSPAQFTHPSSSSGRVLRVDLNLYDSPISIVGVYGPAQQQHRAAFYSEVLPLHLPTDGRPLILAGDFNTVLSDLDCWFPPGHPGLVGPNTRFMGGPQLAELMEDFSLSDIWRASHPTKNQFTHFSRSAGSGARLDRFLLSSSFSQTFSAISSDILPAGGEQSDHSPVSLSFRAPAPAVPRGTGIHAFPLAVLNIPAAVTEIAAIIATHSAALANNPTPLAWRNIKARIRDSSVGIYRKHRRLRQQAAAAAEAAAATARHQLSTNADPAQHAALLAASQTTADASVQAWRDLLDPAELAGKILDHHFGDKSTFYFFQGPKKLDKPTVIRTINRPGRSPDQNPSPADLSTPAGRDLALQYAHDFYASSSPIGLFRARPVDAAMQDTLLGSLPHRLPGCLQHLAEGLDNDGLLTEEDFEYALSESRRGSCPGADGLPYEFYRAFKEALVPMLLLVFNAAFQADDVNQPGYEQAAPLQQLLHGIICLQPKPAQPADELSGYRPITLLNCDVKLVMLILSNRLQRPLDFVIDIVQSAFLRGRDITDNVRYHLGLRARLEELGLPAWLLHSDLKKAYDTVNRPLLIRSLQHMGLRNTGVIRWTSILLNGSSAQVRVNGFFSPAFSISNVSLPQGGALSCQLWLAVAHLLTSYLSSLQHSGQLSSFPLPSGKPAPASAVFADDVTVPIVQPSQLSTTVRPAFQLLAAAGAPEQSASKTALQHLHGPVPPDLDPAAHSQHQPSGYSLLSAAADRSLRHLGVPFAASHADRVRSAFAAQPVSMKAAGVQWQQSALNLYGRALVASQCIASKAIYQSNFHSPPAPVSSSMQTAVNSFVASSTRREEASPVPHRLYPCASIALLPCSAGGLGVPDLEAHFTAMRAKPCWLLFNYTVHPWADLFGHEVSRATLLDNDQDPQDPDNALLLGLPPGPHWLVTQPAAGRRRLDRIATVSYRDSAQAFLDLNVQRIKQPDTQDHFSIMLELTFNNATPGAPGIDVASVTTPAAKSWLRLRDVRQAFLDQAQDRLPLDQAQDLQIILNHLPPQWRGAVRAAEVPDPPWVAIHAPGDALAIFEGPDPMPPPPPPSTPAATPAPPTPPPARRLWLLFRNSGRLEPYTDPAYVRDPMIVPRPALVTTREKPRSAWDRADHDYVEEQKELPPAERRELLEPWLIGFWDELQLDPRVWGVSPDTRPARAPAAPAPAVRAPAIRATAVQDTAARAPTDQANDIRGPADQGPALPIIPSGGCLALLDVDVKSARLKLSRKLALARAIPGYNAHGAVWPELWPRHAIGTAPGVGTGGEGGGEREEGEGGGGRQGLGGVPGGGGEGRGREERGRGGEGLGREYGVRGREREGGERGGEGGGRAGEGRGGEGRGGDQEGRGGDGGGGLGSVASATDRHLALLGLAGMEERWRRSPPPPADDVLDWEPPWLDLTHPPATSARGARYAARTAARYSPPPPPALGPSFIPPDRTDFPGVWARLRDATIYRPFIITAWLILHGKLGCNAFLHHVQRRLPATPCSNLCRSTACSTAGRLETLSHTFLDCPDTAPAVDWLCAAWAALSGKAAPPRTAAVLLADDLQAWTTDSPANDLQLLALWTRLRITVIGSIWQARCARDQGLLRGVSLARSAVMLAVQSLTEAAQRDWLRTTTDIRTLDGGFFCTEWWRGMDPQLKRADFSNSWAYGSVLCSVVEGDEEAAPPRAASLNLFLGQDLPLPFPV